VIFDIYWAILRCNKKKERKGKKIYAEIKGIGYRVRYTRGCRVYRMH